MKRAVAATIVLIAGLSALGFTTRRPAAPVVPFWGYVTQAGLNYVTVVDLSTAGFPFINTINTGSAPKGIVLANSLKRAYVMNSGGPGNTISVIDTDTLVVVSTIALSGGFNQGVELLLSPDEAFLWAAGQISPMNGAVIKINTATNTEVETVDTGEINGACFDMAWQGGPQPRVYVTFPNNGVITQIRYDSGIASNATGFTSINALPAVKWIDVSPDGSRLYATQLTGISPVPVSIVTTDWTVTPTPNNISGLPPGVGTGDDYNEVRFGSPSPPTGYIVRNFIGPNEIRPVDAATDTGVGAANTAVANPETISIDPTNTLMFIGAPGQNFMEVMSLTVPTAPSPIGALAVSIGSPWHVAFGLPHPKPVVEDACSHGGSMSGGEMLQIFGQNFTVGSTVDFFAGVTLSAPMVNVISSNEIDIITPASGFSARFDIIVNAPDAQTAKLTGFYYFTNTTAMRTLPAPSGTTANDYRMVSVAEIATFGQVKAGLEAAMGAYDPQQWRAFFYDPRQNAYLEFSGLPITSCDAAGKSIWLLSRFGGTASIQGLDSGASSPNFVIVLDPGWNMISTPFDNGLGFPSNAASWDAAGANPIQITQDFLSFFNADSAVNPYGDGRLIEWNGASYGMTNLLEPGKGYWVYNKVSGPVYLTVSDPSFKPGPALSKTWAPLEAGSSSPPPPPGSLGDSSDGGSGKCSFGAPGAGDPLMAVALAALVLIAALRILRR